MTDKTITEQAPGASLLILQPVAKYRHPLNQDSLNDLGKLIRYQLIQVTGSSEIVRARCYLAEKAVRYLREQNAACAHVLWLDADMVFSPSLVRAHMEAVSKWGVPIAGLYPQRVKPAAALVKHSVEGIQAPLELEPVLAGMGALMVPANLFLAQYDTSHPCADPEMRRVICPMLLRPHVDAQNGGDVLISEDFSYCLSFFERELGAPFRGVYSPKNEPLCYGHVAEKVLVYGKETKL